MILCPRCREACAGRCSRALKPSRRWFIFGSAAALAAKAVGATEGLWISDRYLLDRKQAGQRLGYVSVLSADKRLPYGGLEIDRIFFDEIVPISPEECNRLLTALRHGTNPPRWVTWAPNAEKYA